MCLCAPWSPARNAPADPVGNLGQGEANLLSLPCVAAGIVSLAPKVAPKFIDAKTGTIVKTKREFGNVALQVLLFALVIAANHTALKDAEEVFRRC